MTKIGKHTLLLCFVLVQLATSQQIRNDLWVTNGEVRAMARDGSTLYIGGNFTQVGPYTGSGVLLNTTSGQRLTPWPAVNGTVYAAASDGAGGWYIGGDFSRVGGIERNHLAHIRSDGTVGNWNPNADGTVYALSLSGSFVYVGGDFQNIGGNSRIGIAAIRREDGVVLAWDLRANGRVLGIEAAEEQNRIYVWGDFTSLSPLNQSFFSGPHLALVNFNGVIQRLYNPSPNGSVLTAALTPEGLFIGGAFTAVGARPRQYLALIDSTGSLQGYTASPNALIRSLKTAGEYLYVAGDFTQIAGVPRRGAAALFRLFSQASGWDPDVAGRVYDITPSAAGIYLAGSFSVVKSQPRNNLARVDSLGNLSAWNPNANAPSVFVRAFGQGVFAGGDFNSVGGLARNNLAALDAQTGVATSWNPGVTGGSGIDAMVLSGSTLFVGGSFTGISGLSRPYLGAVNTETGIATPFNPIPNGDVLTLAISAGRIYAGGAFTTVGVLPRNRIAEIDPISGIATPWNPSANDDVRALIAGTNSVFAGGRFTSIGGQVRNRLAALDKTTGLATSWNPGISGGGQGEVVQTLELSGTDIYIGGVFGTVGSQSRAGVAAVDAVTGAVKQFDVNFTGLPFVQALYKSGPRLYIGGALSDVSGARSDLISVDATTGARIPTWNPLVDGFVYDLTSHDSTLFVGGSFLDILNQNRSYLSGVTDPALETPRLTFSPPSLLFGNVRLGEARVETLFVTNTGGGLLQVTQVSSTNPAYAVSPGSASISSGATQPFTVTFIPVALGIQNASITLAHNAGGPATVPATGFGVSPSFLVNPVSVAFGNVPVNASKTDSVVVTNEGNIPLNISSVTSSSPRFGVTPPSAQIAPGASRKFYIIFMPGTTGNVGGSITFTHDAPGSPSSVVVAGTGVAPAFNVTPRIVSFGNVGLNTTATDSVIVTNPGTAALVISSASTTGARFGVTPSFATVPPLGAQVFRVSFSPLQSGLQSTHVIFTHNGRAVPDSVSLSGTGVTPVFSIEPSSLNFGNVLLGTVRQDSLIVTNSGLVNLVVNSVTSSNPRFSVLPALAVIPPGESTEFYVMFAPLLSGLSSSTLTFTHNAPNSPSVVSVQGAGIVSGFSVQPSSLDFGSVRKGQTKRDSVIVTNTGSASLNISSARPSNAFFSVSPENATLTAGASRTFAVTFNPTMTGTAQGAIIFTHDAPGSPTSVPVAGSGVEPVFSVNPQSRTFGNVVVNSTRTDSVMVTNTGAFPLTISGISSSSSEFIVTPLNAVVPAGQQRAVLISFTPAVAGPRSAIVTFTHDAAGSPGTVNVNGTGIVSTFSIIPSQLNFGSVRVGESKIDSFVVANSGNTVLTISSVASSNPQFAVVPAAGSIPAGASLKFFVTYQPAGGVTQGSIVISHSAPGSPTSVDVQGRGVQPQFIFSRGSLSFGNVRVGGSRQDTVKVLNSGDDTLRISGVRFTSQEFTIVPEEALIPPGLDALFFLTFTPTRGGQVSGAALFDFNGTASPASLSLSGNGIVAVITLIPLDLHFGEVGLGSSAAATVRVVNNGAVNLTVDSLRIRGVNAPEFVIAGSAGPFLPLIPGDSLRVPVRFTPHSVEQGKTAILYVYHDASAAPDMVSLSGSGRSSFVQVNVGGNTRVGGTVTVTATPPAGFNPATARLFFRETGRRTYDSLQLSVSGGSYSVTIPSAAMTVRGVQYYVAFSNQGQTITNPEIDPANNPAVIQILVDSVTSPVRMHRRKFSMVSFPLELSSPTPQAQLFDDYGEYSPFQWRMFRWSEGRYKEFGQFADQLTPGLGFWLITNSGLAFDLHNGRSVFPEDPVALTLQPGWNQIASPFAFPIDWLEVESSSALRLPVAWDGVQYIPNVRTLESWRAYFVHNPGNDNVAILIRPLESRGTMQKALGEILFSNNDYVVRAALTGSSEDERDEYNYFGFVQGSSGASDKFDTPEPPAIVGGISLSFLEPDGQYMSSFKPVNLEGEEWRIAVKGTGTSRVLNLSLTATGLLPQGFSMYVFDEDLHVRVFPTDGKLSIHVPEPSALRTFKIVIGTEEFAARRNGGIPLEPVEFSLSPNYPNPFNPSTILQYSVAQRGHVSLHVYNALGQRIKSLVEGEKVTGRYTIEWDGTNTNGGKVASGIYLVRMQAGAFVASRKLILIR